MSTQTTLCPSVILPIDWVQVLEEAAKTPCPNGGIKEVVDFMTQSLEIIGDPNNELHHHYLEQIQMIRHKLGEIESLRITLPPAGMAHLWERKHDLVKEAFVYNRDDMRLRAYQFLLAWSYVLKRSIQAKIII